MSLSNCVILGSASLSINFLLREIKVIIPNSPGMVVCAFKPNIWEVGGRRIMSSCSGLHSMFPACLHYTIGLSVKITIIIPNQSGEVTKCYIKNCIYLLYRGLKPWPCLLSMAVKRPVQEGLGKEGLFWLLCPNTRELSLETFRRGPEAGTVAEAMSRSSQLA